MADLPDTSFNPDVIAEFRANGGKVGGPWQHSTLLLLHTTGAKSGAPRVNPVGYFDIDGKVIIVGSYGGADIHPAWAHNLRAHPRTQIEIGPETIDVEARELPSGPDPHETGRLRRQRPHRAARDPPAPRRPQHRGCRHPTTRHLPVTDPRLTVAEADVFQQQAVAGVLPGADAVLSVLGVPFTRRPVDMFSTGTANIVAAMRRNAIRRLIVVSSTATHQYRNRRNSSLMLRIFEPVISRTIGKTVYHDVRRMESIVRDSDLDWTIVRPSILFDLDHPTGYIAGDVPPVGGFTARIDLAHYLTTLIDDAASIGATPIVSTTDGAPTFWEYIKRQSVRPS